MLKENINNNLNDAGLTASETFSNSSIKKIQSLEKENNILKHQLHDLATHVNILMN